LITKIRIIFWAALLLGMAAAWGLFLAEHRNSLRLQKAKAQLQSELSLAEQKRKMAESPAVEKKIFKPKVETAAVNGAPIHKGTAAPDQSSCWACFENFQYAVEVKDTEDNWIFRDDNIFDQTPGKLTLTEHFWQGASNCRQGGEQSSAKPPAPKRLKNRLLVGLELGGSRMEYAYSPLGIRTKNLELGLTAYSALYLNYSFFPVSAAAGIGLEARF